MEQLRKSTNYFFSDSKGQLLVEILLAIAITAIMLPALLTGLIASQQGKAQQSQRVQAVALMKESDEIVLNLKNQDWNNISTNGTFHPEIFSNNWRLSSGSEVINGLTRSVVISDVYRDSNGSIVTTGGTIDLSTKRAVSTISWGTPFASSVVSTLYLTRYANNAAGIQTTTQDFNNGSGNGTVVSDNAGGEVTLGAGGGGGDWCNPSLSVTSFDLSRQGIPTAISATSSSNINSIVTGTGGNASGPTFVKTSVNGNTPPDGSFIGEYDNAKANSVFTDGDYGYIATTNNGEEIQILNMSQFSNPPTNTQFLKVGYFNAPGNTQGDSIFVKGNYGYMVSDDKFYIFDLTSKSGSRTQLNPTAVTLSGIGKKIVVVGSYAYVVTNSTTNQLQIINVTNPTSPSLASSITLGTVAGVDVSVNASGTRAYVITNQSATQQELYIVNTTNKSAPAIIPGSYNTGLTTPMGVSVATGNRVVIVGIGGTYQYQVVNIANETAPVMCGQSTITNGGYAVSTVLQDDGYAYSYVATGDSNAELKIVLGGAGGQFTTYGEFTSMAIDATTSASFNYFNPIFTLAPSTSLQFRVAVANTPTNSCDDATYTYVGPDGQTDSFYTGPGQIPLLTNGSYTNPGRCMKYRAYFSSGDINSTPILEDVIINFSP